MGEVKTYSPDKVSLADGSHIVTGFAEDSFIVITPIGDGTSYVRGADGEIARTVNMNNMYTVKITLLQTSASNEYFQKRYDKDQNDGDAIDPITIKDLMGKEKFFGQKSWVTKPAERKKGKTQENIEWEIVVAEGGYTNE